MNNYNTLINASYLLDDENLVWSDDFEQIRKELSKWLIYEAACSYSLDRNPVVQALSIATQLLKDEHELA
jgi:hypothetical protein